MVAMYVSDFVPSALTYIFLILASNWTGTETIGTIGFIISFSFILSTLSNFDVAIGMKRFLGKSFAEKEWSTFKQISASANLFTLLSTSILLVIVFNPIFSLSELLGFDNKLIPIIIFIVLGNNFHNIFKGILSSALRSESLIISTIIASIIRIPLLFILFYFSFSENNVSWAYASFFGVISVFLFVITLNYFRTLSGTSFKNIQSNVHLLIKGSLPRWIPNIIGVLGTRINMLIIFSSSGASETGLFYIPFAIFGILLLATNAINQIAHPVFSGIQDSKSQHDFLQRTLKFSFIGTFPLVGIMFFYSKEILSIFGTSFSLSNEILSILLVGLPFIVFSEAIFYMLYAKGRYKDVFFLGLAANIPRIALYIVLIPVYGNEGAAYAFTAGSLIQTILTIFLVNKYKIKIRYLLLAKIAIIPFIIGGLLKLLDFNLIGIVIIFVLSYILYLRLKIINETELNDFLTMISTKKNNLQPNKIIKILQKMKLL